MEARTLTADTAAEIAEWCGGLLVEEIDAFDDTIRAPGVNVPCGTDVRRASVGDVVIQKQDGTFFIHKY